MDIRNFILTGLALLGLSAYYTWNRYFSKYPVKRELAEIPTDDELLSAFAQCRDAIPDVQPRIDDAKLKLTRFHAKSERDLAFLCIFSGSTHGHLKFSETYAKPTNSSLTAKIHRSIATNDQGSLLGIAAGDAQDVYYNVKSNELLVVNSLFDCIFVYADIGAFLLDICESDADDEQA